MSTQESNQWYTPPEILDLVQEYFRLSNPDLKWFDPTCAPESPAAFYANGGCRTGIGGPEDDALSDVDWPLEHLFMNPPYSDPKPFTERFVQEIRRVKTSGTVSPSFRVVHGRAGIVLVNSATSTQWWQDLVKIANGICFVSPRIRFLRPRSRLDVSMESAYRNMSGIDLVRPSSPRYESCLVCFGNYPLFKETFEELGQVLKVGV